MRVHWRLNVRPIVPDPKSVSWPQPGHHGPITGAAQFGHRAMEPESVFINRLQAWEDRPAELLYDIMPSLTGCSGRSMVDGLGPNLVASKTTDRSWPLSDRRTKGATSKGRRMAGEQKSLTPAAAGLRRGVNDPS